MFGPYFRFLSLLPALVDLRLNVNRSQLQPIAWPHDQAITPIVLPKLEKLELLRLPGHTTAALLRSIESQSCQKIRVRVVGIEGFRDLRVSSFTMETAVSKVIASPALIEITMKTENTLEIEVAREAEQKLSLVIESHHGPSEFARSLLTDVEHSQVTTLKLSGRKLGLAQSVASHLPDLLSLKELYLADIRDSDAILIALAESHNAQKWICPKLTSLDLKGTTTYDKQKLIYMLQYRYEDQSLRGSNPSDPTPMHLHKLALNYRGEDSHEMLKKEYMEKLESIIGADSCEFAWNRDRNQDGRTNGLS
ncbi:hypothetical protein FRC03_006622 [Tulasnella sp. 419]|nr:hypothetical protein FRC03_006622 [Tulasnella sp. 419]